MQKQTDSTPKKGLFSNASLKIRFRMVTKKARLFPRETNATALRISLATSLVRQFLTKKKNTFAS
jgi:hypothetical protein